MALSIYFIYQKKFNISLFKYALLQTMMVFPKYLRPLIAIMIDNVAIWNSNRKSYLFLFFVVDVFAFCLLLFCSHEEVSIWVIILLNFVLSFNQSIKEEILISLTFQLKSLYQIQEQEVGYKLGQQSLGFFYGMKLMGELASYVLIYLVDLKSKLKSPLFLHQSLLPQPGPGLLLQRNQNPQK
jgi:hypothetical protein